MRKNLRSLIPPQQKPDIQPDIQIQFFRNRYRYQINTLVKPNMN